LEARGISKAFPGVQALEDVNLRVFPGEVLAVVGENGAGKSTLMKILAGVLQLDAGVVELAGQPVRPASVQEAERLGIVLIHQELNLADKLDVAGNLFLGREPTWGGPLRLLSRKVYPQAEAITRRIGLECSPRTIVEQLPVGQQQLVEIGRALSLESRILIMDEPTSSLTQRETDRLFRVIRDLKRDGVSILYISHRLQEVEVIADRVAVLRDGRNAGELERAEIRHETIVRMMVGRELKRFYQRTHSVAAAPRPRLRAQGLRWLERAPQASDLVVGSGEIVGLAGLMGAGRTELAEALFGIRPLLAGEVHLDGQRVCPRSPAEAIAAGILLVPEDRRLQGLILHESVKNNISLGSMDRLSWLRLVALKREAELAHTMRQRLNIRTPSVRQTVGLLSGGNQQKVVLAKWLSRSPRLLILDEPTRGVDVGAKAEIYALMDQLAGQGVGILMISSELEEILGMSDRVLVMHEGHIAGELPRSELSEQAIMHLATGGKAPS
jgi:ribose transport system ATP-binding protein